MKPVLLLGALLAAPLRAEDRFFAFASDYLQALHRAHSAEQAVVDGRRPLVSLVLSLTEQAQRLNEARELLLPYQRDRRPEIRKSAEGLLSGVALFSLTTADDLADINAMNNRWELARRLDGRADDRRRAVEVLAASVGFFREAMVGKASAEPRLARDEAASLWKQVNLLFGEDLAGGGARTSPVLVTVEELRKDLRTLFRDLPPPG